jgi:hypothetical protein
VRIVVGSASGGGTDIAARLIGQWLSERPNTACGFAPAGFECGVDFAALLRNQHVISACLLFYKSLIDDKQTKCGSFSALTGL